MRILYVANALDVPSHEWMRRMLYGLGSDVAMVATNSRACALANTPAAVQIIAAPPLVLRAANRLRILRHSPWDRYHCDAMTRLLSQHHFTAILVHFLTTAVSYAESVEPLQFTRLRSLPRL